MPPRAKNASPFTVAVAAATLCVNEADVADVSVADEGTVATTTDGERYVLHEDGTFTWLHTPPRVRQILKGD